MSQRRPELCYFIVAQNLLVCRHRDLGFVTLADCFTKTHANATSVDPKFAKARTSSVASTRDCVTVQLVLTTAYHYLIHCETNGDTWDMS